MTEMTPICSCDICLRKRRLLAPSNDISILVEAAHRPQFLFSNMFGVFFKEAEKLKISLAKYLVDFNSFAKPHVETPCRHTLLYVKRLPTEIAYRKF